MNPTPHPPHGTPTLVPTDQNAGRGSAPLGHNPIKQRSRGRRITIGIVCAGLVAMLCAVAAALGTSTNKIAADSSGGAVPRLAQASAAPTAAASTAAGSAADAEATAGSSAAARNPSNNKLPATDPRDVPTGKPQIIYTGSVSVETDNVQKAADSLGALATRLGGFVSTSKVNTDDTDGAYAIVTIRVPSGRFDETRREIAKLGKAGNENVSTNDVTMQSADLTSRINDQKASIARIRALYAKATTISDITELESELTSRESTYNSLLAQQAALSDQVAMSTYTATFSTDGTAPQPIPAKQHPGLWQGLKAGWTAFGHTTFAVGNGLGRMAPFLVAIAILASPGYLWWRRRRGTGRRGDGGGGGTAGSGADGNPASNDGDGSARQDPAGSAA